jgi:hypothetical protein
MGLNYKYTILYTFVSLCLFYIIIFWFKELLKNQYISIKESFDNNTQINTEYTLNMPIIPFPKDALIDYNKINGPEYSHTVNLSINDPITCKNFCGPKSQCLLTRNQCTSDIDCPGCLPNSKPFLRQPPTNVKAYEDSGKIGQQGLTYSPLINKVNLDMEEVYPGSKNSVLKRPYQGVDMWEKSFNDGLKIYDRKMMSKYRLNNFEKYIEPKYPMTISTTGTFYNTGPNPSNIDL